MRLDSFLSSSKDSGFTLIELLLVVAILSLILVVSAPFYISFDNYNELDVASNILEEDLYQAQLLSRVEADNCGWGVAINSGVIALYCGDSYADRNAEFDNDYTVPNTVQFSGLQEVDFSKLYGLPQTTGSFSLSNNDKNVSVSINPKGMVDY
jgi:prepilin-type N-terminal cleavage/methylation domain-containing protein